MNLRFVLYINLIITKMKKIKKLKLKKEIASILNGNEMDFVKGGYFGCGVDMATLNETCNDNCLSNVPTCLTACVDITAYNV